MIQTRIRVLRLLCWGVFFGAGALLGSWLRARQIALGPPVLIPLFGALVVFGFALERFTPYFAQICPVDNEAATGFPLYSAYESAKEKSNAQSEDI